MNHLGIIKIKGQQSFLLLLLLITILTSFCLKECFNKLFEAI